MLELREMTDDILSSYELSDLHLERNKNGLLELVGKCGKPMVTLFGVSAPRKVSGKERDYLFKLISSYLTENATNIKEVIDAKLSIRNPLDITNKYLFSTSGYSRNFKYYIYLDESQTSGFCSLNKNVYFYGQSDTEIDRVEYIIEHKDEMLSYLKEYISVCIETDAINARIKEMSSCTI